MRVVLAGSVLLLAIASPGAVALADEGDPTLIKPPEVEAAERANPPWNEYDGEYFTLRIGFGFLVDHADFSQSADSADQMDLDDTYQLRDFRLLASGRLKFAPRVQYTVGYMWDDAADSWRFRQTGLRFQAKELGGNLFIGRTKEGFSTNKIMVGYYGWFAERSAANDAFIPILGDGLKWTGAAAGGQLVYNVGWFTDILSEVESFNRNDGQFVGRAVWLPLVNSDSGEVLHLAVQGRYGLSDDGGLHFRSKPEAFEAQENAVDTGRFDATSTTMLGLEAYFQSGGLIIGTEYYLNQVSSEPADDPFFHGGELSVTYMIGGERAYNRLAAVFMDVKPTKPVFSGGWGAWDLAVRLSHVDLDDGTIAGGKFTRISPQVNWYLTEVIRFELMYGYGVLDRDGMDGSTHFLQGRMQIAL